MNREMLGNELQDTGKRIARYWEKNCEILGKELRVTEKWIAASSNQQMRKRSPLPLCTNHTVNRKIFRLVV